MEKTCKGCGSAVQLNALFCTNCGERQARTCSACGASVIPGAKFCGECGVTVQPDRSEKGAPAEEGGRPMQDGPVAEPTNMSNEASASVPADEPPPFQVPNGSAAVSPQDPAADIRARNKVVSLIATIFLMTGVAYSLTTGDSPDQAATAEAEATAAVLYDGNSEKTPDAAGEAVVAEVEPADTSGTEPATTDSVPQPDQQDQLAGDSATVAAPVEKRAISYSGEGSRSAHMSSQVAVEGQKPTPPLPVTQPRFSVEYLYTPQPPYPSMSRRMGEEGEVRLRVQVDPSGNAQQIEVYRSSGFSRLDQAAQDTVKQWRFVPARQGDQTVAAWIIVPIQFSLRS